MKNLLALLTLFFSALSIESYAALLASCNEAGIFIPNGGSRVFYAADTVPNGTSCYGQTRVCINGKLTGDFSAASCSVQPATKFFPDSKVVSLKLDGRTRKFRLLIPSGVPSTEKLPLIVVLHGTWGSGMKMERGLGFDEYAQQRKFVVAYPDAYVPEGEQKSYRWNDGRGVTASARHRVDDVAFLRALVANVAAQRSIDLARVFVTGASNGGMMTYRIGCEAADMVNAIAPVIGNIAQPLEAGCRPSRAISLLSINGSDDPMVPLKGGAVCDGVSRLLCEGGEVTSFTQSTSKFTDAAACRTIPALNIRRPLVNDGTRIESATFVGCRAGTEVQNLVVRGGGHAWPPQQAQVDVSGVSTKNLDATKEIVDFFLRQPPRAPSGTGVVMGYVDSASTSIEGWACAQGWSNSIEVHAYVASPGGDIMVGGRIANKASEPAVAASCGTNGGAYRFSIPLSLQLRWQHIGKPILVYGISPIGGPNNKLQNSGVVRVR